MRVCRFFCWCVCFHDPVVVWFLGVPVSHEPLNVGEGEDIARVLMPGRDVDAEVDLSSACAGEEVCCVHLSL